MCSGAAPAAGGADSWDAATVLAAREAPDRVACGLAVSAPGVEAAVTLVLPWPDADDVLSDAWADVADCAWDALP